MFEMETLFTIKPIKNYHPKKQGPIYKQLCARFPLYVIHSQKQHHAALKILELLSEKVLLSKANKTIQEQVLYYVEALGILVEEYEKEKLKSKLKDISNQEILLHLMEEHQLNQSDLKNELGSQSIVSEILSGKRKLNSGQIARLAKRFHVSAAVFF